jgi:hypothetical protein
MAVVIVTGAMSPDEAPPVRIMSDINGNPIAYKILLNQWNGAIYDRVSYIDVLFENAESDEVSLCDIDQVITFNFGRYNPDKMNLVVDFNTNPVVSYRRPVVNVALDGMAFSHPPLPAGYSDNAGRRFYVLTCSWGNNEAEYAFVVDVRGEQDPTVESGYFNISSAQVDWMEISPEMSSTTYVDDSGFINRVINLLTQKNVRPATQQEVTEMKTTQPDPPEVTIDGNTYKRNVVVEFIQKVEEEKTETITTVQLCGDLIRINDNYYTSASVTDEFIVILNDIHKQGKGKSSVEIL